MIKLKPWLTAAGIRAVRTMAQTALGVIGSAAVITEVHWQTVLFSVLLAGVVALLTALAGLPEISENEDKVL